MKLDFDEIKRFVIKNLRWIILFICMVCFFAIAEDVWEKELIEIDTIGYFIISKFLIKDAFTPIAKCITNLGSVYFIGLLILILFILIKNKKIGVAIFINAFSVFTLNTLLKNILQRPRPTGYRLIDESGYSFPSGHSMVSMAFYGFLVYLVYKYVNNKTLKIFLMIVLSIIPILIGISRIYLGVHYTSDVIGGFFIAISYIIIYTKVFRKLVIDEENK